MFSPCLTSTRRVLAAVGLALAAGLSNASGGTAANAETITNTARFSFQQGGETRTVESNTVVLNRAPPPSPAQVTFWRTPDVASDLACRNGSGAYEPAPQRASAPSDAGVPRIGTATRSKIFHAGEPVMVRLLDLNRNVLPDERETVEVELTTSDGDQEFVRLTETGGDTGLFSGTIASKEPPVAKLDCALSIQQGSIIQAHYSDKFYPVDISEAEALVDPYGYVFDTRDGSVVDGARVTMIDADTGLPAAVFGDDGRSRYPSSVISGGGATDASGRVYQFPPGGYRFPLVATGGYRLLIETPAGYTAPSQAAPAALRAFKGPDGQPYELEQGSYADVFFVLGPLPLKVDLPVDSLDTSLLLDKSASIDVASAGDFVQYTLQLQNLAKAGALPPVVVTDTLPAGLRYRAGSLRVGEAKAADPAISADGQTLTFGTGALAAEGSVTIRYVVQVDGRAQPGEALNSAVATAGRTVSNRAQAAIRIVEPLFTDRFTIIGRVLAGDCGATERTGVGGVRILLQDGTFTVTDADGLYHFEGVRPGTHVVQLDQASVPEGFAAVDCARNTRSGGRAFSQFVEARGGALQRVDFHLRHVAGAARPAAAVSAPKIADDVTAAGGGRDWAENQQPGVAWLFPDAHHNPRAPAIRVVVKHHPGQKVRLTLNGQPADVLAFDGTDTDGGGKVVVSQWRGLPLAEGDNQLVAEVTGADGKVERLTRSVHYGNTPVRADVVVAASTLVADGRTRPVVAVRLTDRAGKPVRAGTTGVFKLAPPYKAALEVDARQQQQLSGLAAADPTYTVTGDDGVALIALAPTNQSGAARLSFQFQSGRERSREPQELKAWLKPGQQDWVVVGFAKGTAGFDTLRSNATGGPDADLDDVDGQVSLYAKGRVLGRWILTLAYDSAKDDDRDRRRSLLSTIDPQRYYTIYGDGSEQGYDASSQHKLYLRLERDQFYALFGDYETGLTETELTRYSRTLQGVKTELQADVPALRGSLNVKAFAADTGLNYAREELQGEGLSGLYRLARRDLIINSEKVRIETRDRFRSERIVATETLQRHIDYEIDHRNGTLTFRRPIPSRDADLNPVFVVVEYETGGLDNDTALNAGGRVGGEWLGGRVTAGASYIHDDTNRSKTDLAGVDLTLRPNADTEIRIEAAHSDGALTGGSAYLAEIEHRSERLDALAYVRQQDAGFGLGQQNGSEVGTRKYGGDARYALTDRLSLLGSGYREESLLSGATRDVAEAQIEHRTNLTTLRAGFQGAVDRFGGETLTSRNLTLGASHALLDGRLIVDAESAFSLSGKNDSVDFPTRYRLGASYAIRDDVRLLVSQEITDGERFDSSTTRFGAEVTPWRGAQVTGAVNQQAMTENGERTYAALGLAQTLPLNERLSVDLSLDSNITFNGEPTSRDGLNPAQPISSGGFVGGDGGLTEDFYAVSGGATYRTEFWTWNGRVEYRDGDRVDQVGLIGNGLRQTRAGVAFAAAFRAFQETEATGREARLATLDLSWAYRPLGSSWSVLDKLEFRHDEALNGDGFTPALGGLTVAGDARSSRIVNNLAVNFLSADQADDDEVSLDFRQRSQLSLYYGAKYVFDRFDDADYAGFTDVARVEYRRDLGRRFDVGLHGGVLHSWDAETYAYSAGVSVGVSPADNVWLSVGYNAVGYDDPDFDAAGYTRKGPFVTLRFKFDQQTAGDVGRLLGRARR